MSEATPIQRPRILIVEDEHIVAADLRMSLEGLGCDVVATVDSGLGAIRQAEQSRPDLVLMDIQLQGPTDGIAAAAEIRRRWSIPIVFVTANANDEMLGRANATAPYGYVIKPFRTTDLNATIQVALNQHRLLQDLFREHTWLQTTLDSVNDGFIATDAEGFVRYINPSAEALTGWKLPDALGNPIEDVYPLSDMSSKPVKHCQLRRALQTAAPIPKERFLLAHVDGHKIPVEDAAAPIVNGGRVGRGGYGSSPTSPSGFGTNVIRRSSATDWKNRCFSLQRHWARPEANCERSPAT